MIWSVTPSFPPSFPIFLPSFLLSFLPTFHALPSLPSPLLYVPLPAALPFFGSEKDDGWEKKKEVCAQAKTMMRELEGKTSLFLRVTIEEESLIAINLPVAYALFLIK